MSRRCHHGSPRHLRQVARERRRGPVVADRPSTTPDDRPLGAPLDDHAASSDEGAEQREALAEPFAEDASFDDDAPDAEAVDAEAAVPVSAPTTGPALIAPGPSVPVMAAAVPPDIRAQAAPPPAAWPVRAATAPAPNGPPSARPPHRPREAGPDLDAGSADLGAERGATAPQLRRFIKSRAYVPMHELRRRFAINGGDDDVIPIDVDRQRVYVGLPPHEGSLLGELLRAGDIGYELSLDPIAPIVVGVYPMRPVPRS